MQNGFLYQNHERIIHSFKTALACLIGFGITRLIHIPSNQWVIITILVVMCAQVNVGSVIQKSYMRFLGTLAGSFIAGMTLVLFSGNATIVALVITLVAFSFSYIATSEANYSDAGTLGAVTVTIILLTINSTPGMALERFFEITLGLLIASLVSQFILPIHARSHIARAQADALKKLQEYYQAALISKQTPELIETYHDIDEDIVKSLSKQRLLAKESKRELLGLLFDAAHFDKILQCEKEVFRSIVCMRYACDLLPSGRVTLEDMTVVRDFHQAVYLTLGRIAQGLENHNFDGVVIPSVDAIKPTILSLGKSRPEEEGYMLGFLFCAELLGMQLRRLVKLLQ